jgi:hypothetical protein
MSPIEKNARRLVGVLAEFFPAGSDCEDLRLKFQKIANRKHATFYSCLRFAKANHWIVTDGKTYTLNPDGCWRPPPIGEGLERHQFEHVLTMRAAQIEPLQAIIENWLARFENRELNSLSSARYDQKSLTIKVLMRRSKSFCYAAHIFPSSCFRGTRAARCCPEYIEDHDVAHAGTSAPDAGYL